MGGDLAERVIPGGQAQKHFWESEVINLQGSTAMSKGQWMKSIHSTQHQVTGESHHG